MVDQRVDQKENSKHPQLIVNQRDDKDKPLRTWCLSRNFFDLMVLTVGFNLLFVAFGTAQGFAAPLLGDLGSISLLVRFVHTIKRIEPNHVCAAAEHACDPRLED